MAILVSYIVPVFNVEGYLDRCVESLLGQGIPENQFEIILINDGSTDSSLSICNRWKAKEKCIHVINQVNKGAGEARNAGLDYATGRWVCFVDPDDYLSKGAMVYLFSHFETDGYDAVLYSYKEEPDGIEVDCSILNEGHVLFDGNGMEYIERYGFEPYAVLFMIKKSYIDDHEIRFSNHSFGEDRLFVCKLLFSSPAIMMTSSIVYHYVRRLSSSTKSRTPEKLTRCIFDQTDVFCKVMDYACNYGTELAKKQCSYSIQKNLVRLFDRIAFSSLTFKDFLNITIKLKAKRIVPIHGKGMIDKKAVILINTMCRFPFLYSLIKHPLKYYLRLKNHYC